MKNKMFRVLMLLVSVTLILAACSGGDEGHKKKRTRSPLIPAASGNPYEVMVVADDSVWDGYVGLALKDVLNKPMPGLPQEESTFHVSRVEQKHFDRITNIFRNIIVIKISDHFTQPKINLVRDEHSSPQLIMTIQGPDQASISAYITEQTRFIINFFSAEEINREATRLETEHNMKFAKEVKAMFGCELYIPVDINKMKIGDNFIWASNDGLSSIQNIVIYSYPYVSEKVFRKRAYIALRDSFMKKNIPGGKPNQYMATDKDFVKVKDMQVQGVYTQEARGLWQMENDAMGGPFVAHSQVDTINNRVIVVEGFVYAPDKMKRTMVRRLEAALYTLKLPGSKDDAE